MVRGPCVRAGQALELHRGFKEHAVARSERCPGHRAGTLLQTYRPRAKSIVDTAKDTAPKAANVGWAPCTDPSDSLP